MKIITDYHWHAPPHPCHWLRKLHLFAAKIDHLSKDLCSETCLYLKKDVAEFKSGSISGSYYEPLLLLEASGCNAVHQPVDIHSHFSEVHFEGINIMDTPQTRWFDVCKLLVEFAWSTIASIRYQPKIIVGQKNNGRHSGRLRGKSQIC